MPFNSCSEQATHISCSQLDTYSCWTQHLAGAWIRCTEWTRPVVTWLIQVWWLTISWSKWSTCNIMNVEWYAFSAIGQSGVLFPAIITMRKWTMWICVCVNVLVHLWKLHDNNVEHSLCIINYWTNGSYKWQYYSLLFALQSEKYNFPS